MSKLATACGTILFAILVAMSLAANHLPPNVTIGLTLFGVCLTGVLALAARLAFVDRTRG